MSDQRQLFDHDLYLDVCGRNARKIKSLFKKAEQSGMPDGLGQLTLGSLAVERRLEMVVAILTDLRVLPANFELLYELELEKELSEL